MNKILFFILEVCGWLDRWKRYFKLFAQSLVHVEICTYRAASCSLFLVVLISLLHPEITKNFNRSLAILRFQPFIFCCFCGSVNLHIFSILIYLA